MFKQQIEEDIALIQKELFYIDSNLSKDAYAFNYWVLSRIFSIDEELIPELITEYSDKAIDCFVHFEDSKELYIVQNKYYALDSAVARTDVADFLNTPISVLKNNNYSKSSELQNIFNRARDDSEYKIFLYFFATTQKESSDIKNMISTFNSAGQDLRCYIEAKYFGIKDIYELYYGKNYKENINFTHPLGTLNKGTFASLREEYGMDESYKAYYIVTPVSELYKMILAAEKKNYSIFERNIREYLGSNPINNGIIETLKSDSERKNFMYYNNGITIVCEKIQTDYIDNSSRLRVLPLVNPQIVNGCQTVNSIKKVLENLSENEVREEYKNVYVMVKALVIEDMDDQKNITFYSNVVKYTNKQNAISDKAFVSNIDSFYRMQQEFEKRGFLLFVRPSDKNSYKEKLNKTDRANLIQKANVTIRKLDISIVNYTDICIPLEKLLQVFLALMKTGYFAFSKKNLILKQNGDVFENYCLQIHNYLTIDNMIKLYCLYKKAEAERIQSNDKRTPIPYYIIGFLGELIGEKNNENIQEKLNYIFRNSHVFEETYKYLVMISKSYKRTYEKDVIPGDYNSMIKKMIDKDVLKYAIGLADDMGDWLYIKNWKSTI